MASCHRLGAYRSYWARGVLLKVECSGGGDASLLIKLVVPGEDEDPLLSINVVGGRGSVPELWSLLDNVLGSLDSIRKDFTVDVTESLLCPHCLEQGRCEEASTKLDLAKCRKKGRVPCKQCGKNVDTFAPAIAAAAGTSSLKDDGLRPALSTSSMVAHTLSANT